MFTGLVEEIGTVRSLRRQGEYQHMEIACAKVLEGSAVGDSISLDGVCQTVTAIRDGAFCVEALAATLKKTTLGHFRQGRRVNLERAMSLGDRLGGHLVQGHIDAVGRLAELRIEDKNVFLSVKLPDELLPLCVAEGSIALDGVSLTIAGISGSRVRVNVIPLTWRETVLSERKTGDGINIEVDIIGRYVARMLEFSGDGTKTGAGLSRARLESLGYV
ncbi:riboflavin synthase [Marispirochaeta aestuarii]|uniref:riboflavin synthase n=1 Tax=Marispirochaeta aestuarii TaxID=1963862 RepID=UPI0029C6CC8A|nr:riboflavin synthase [Marispirochaeta aestuarii]